MNYILTQQPAFRVIALKAGPGHEGIMAVWKTLEARFGLNDRKCYGLIYISEDGGMEYYAGFAESGALSAHADMRLIDVAAGPVAQTTLMDWRENIEQISKLFGELGAQVDVDPTRPCVEDYISPTELNIVIPVRP